MGVFAELGFMSGRLARARAKKWKKHRSDKSAFEILVMGKRLKVPVEGVDRVFLLSKFKRDRRVAGMGVRTNGE